MVRSPTSASSPETGAASGLTGGTVSRARAYSAIFAAMARAGRIQSTVPSAIALRGMLSVRASSGSWAMVTPPCSLMARSPTAPSLPAPERMMPMAASPCSSASEQRKASIDAWRGWRGPLSRSVRPSSRSSALGGTT